VQALGQPVERIVAPLRATSGMLLQRIALSALLGLDSAGRLFMNPVKKLVHAHRRLSPLISPRALVYSRGRCLLVLPMDQIMPVMPLKTVALRRSHSTLLLLVPTVKQVMQARVE
jgi:hypothetical protein